MKVRGNMKKTYDEYYKVCDILKQLPLCTYIPSDYDLDYMSDYFEETFEFIVYGRKNRIKAKNTYRSDCGRYFFTLKSAQQQGCAMRKN